MDNWSLSKKLYYGYVGRAYAVAYRLQNHHFLGLRVSTWLSLLLLATLTVGWVQRWDAALIIGLALLFLFIQITYWRTRRVGYNKFVPSEQAVLPPESDLTPLPRDHRITVQATGVFSVSNREDFILLGSPAEYWQVPLGDHAVMVEQKKGKFLYQFFNARHLQQVQPGWLIFGGHPRRTLAVTFLLTWSPDLFTPTVFFYAGGENTPQPSKKRTIYLTVADEADYEAIWHNLVYDARQTRLRAEEEGE